MTNLYFDELAERLRARGLPEDEVSRTVDDLAAFVAESGTDPVQEFGTPEDFVSQVAPDGAGAGARTGPVPPDEAETWKWRADAFHEREVLNRYGDEGWEVERVDSTGRFVTHRDPDDPQRWEYRRETVLPGRRNAVVDRLAPDGWEPCGTWICFEYFKRPKAASLGPEAELRDVPGTPSGRNFWSKRFYGFIASYGALLGAVCAVGVFLAPDGSHTAVLTGVLIGAMVLLALAAGRIWRDRRRRSF
ncbi:hypothetical protein [Actinomadura sp. NPDC049753]|uniref:hypothetical protein n=1 Tax=Actinomadura sp. NPDC049753 TaxID=3154739 RepID=UPI00342FE06E